MTATGAGLTVLVLAGDRRVPDPVAVAAGTSCKALAVVGGTPMLLRVVDAVRNGVPSAPIVLCGPPRSAIESCADLQRLLDSGIARWAEPGGSPTLSVASGLQQVAGVSPVLITTADHALLSADMVRHFIAQSLATAADATVGLVRHDSLLRVLPASRRTVLRFSDDHWCTSNLFCLLTPEARTIVSTWRAVEEQRKRPARVIAGMLGVGGIVAYALGRLSLADALDRFGRRLGLRLAHVEMPQPLAAVDVDTAEDLELARSLAQRR
jgi:GTP:adenosylcobinamide-phosphate guanylyltransferase